MAERVEAKLGAGVELDNGESFPSILLEEVRVLEVSEPFWSAWGELSGQRSIGGMGAVGELRYEAVSAWLDENGIDHIYERQRYRKFLSRMDSEFLNAMAERSRAESRKVQDATKSMPQSRGRGKRTERVRM